MKILHLISQHPESTGSGIYLQNIMRQATAAGHENFLIAGISEGQAPGLSCIDSDRCLFVNFGTPPLTFTIPGMSDVMPYPSSRFSSLTEEQIIVYEQVFRETVAQAVKRFSPDIIHSHHLWLASRSARKTCPHLPQVTSCHSTDLRQLALCPHLREKVTGGCADIDRVLALSQLQANEINAQHSFPENRTDIIGGGFDTKMFIPGEKHPAPPVEILYAGKLSYAKGVDLLLDVFGSLSEDDLHLHLAGSGSGPEAEHCLQLAANLGGRVTVHGRISQPALSTLMQRAHIFVLPSFYEGLPLVLLEAVACGCRIVTTELPCCRELLADAGGELTAMVPLGRMRTIDQPEPQDVPLIAERLREGLLKMAGLVQASHMPDYDAIKKITGPYDWSSVFARIEKSYREARAGRR